MKTFVLLLCLALVVAAFALEDFDEDDEYVKRAVNDLREFMEKRGRKGRKSAYFNCFDDYGNPCVCKMVKGKKSPVQCL